MRTSAQDEHQGKEKSETMNPMTFGPESSDADAIYFAAFEALGNCVERHHLEDGDNGLHHSFLDDWLRRAEQAGWIRPDGARWCITPEGQRRYSNVRDELGISNEFSIGLPAGQPRSWRLWRRNG